MKKILTLGTLMLTMLTACHQKTAGVSAAAGDSFDSLTVDIDSMGVSMTLKIYGTPGDTLMKHCLAQYVGDRLFFADDEEPIVHKPDYDGQLRTFLYACTRQKWDELKYLTFPPRPEGEDNSEIPTPEELLDGLGDDACLTSYYVEFQKVYETDSIVSWTCQYSVYVNATAHPSGGFSGITFSKADGTTLGPTLLKDTYTAGFHQLQKEALREYVIREFGETDVTDDKLKHLLPESLDINALPMPEDAPYLDGQGVALPYS